MIKKNISSYLNLYFQEEMKFLQKEIYPYTTRMDYSTKKYRCMNIEKKNLISLIEALFWKENYKFLYKIFGIMPVRKDVKLLFDDLPEPNANREVEGIVLEKVKGFKFISSINGLDQRYHEIRRSFRSREPADRDFQKRKKHGLRRCAEFPERNRTWHRCAAVCEKE